MSRTTLYVVIGVLAVVVVGLAAHALYRQSQQPRLEIRVDGQGITVDGQG